MYSVLSAGDEASFNTLAEALSYAKKLDIFVTIKGDECEIVGKFGVDSVKDGKCPDGFVYDWNKKSRIGRMRK